MRFTLYDCDVGIKVDGVGYDFTHVRRVTVEDPEFNRLTRGANAGNKTGLSYKEGLTEPKRMTMSIMNMTPEIKAVLDNLFETVGRCDVYVVSRADGSNKMGKEAVLCQRPQQLNLDDSPDSLEVLLTFETFDITEDHKS
jgi:hypothetical protein